jgi:type IV pilus assembly protein PilW
MAGYWGELTTTPSSPSTLSNPCATAVAGAGNLDEAMGLHVQGYNSPATPPGCLANVKSGTDILVVRHADPDTSDVESGGVVDWAKLQAGQVYLQTGIDTATNAFGSKLRVADGATDSANFTLKRRDKVTVASPRKYLVHIYYIATCSVCTGGSADTIPTLKRVELGVSAGTTAMSSTPVTIAEGIENLQVDYGNDTDGDGAADGVDQDSSACNVIAANAACTGAPLPSYTPVDWGNVMTVKIHLLARNTETTPGYSDTKSYAMGTASAAATSDAYRRHVFVQSVRVVNPSSRRAN